MRCNTATLTAADGKKASFPLDDFNAPFTAEVGKPIRLEGYADDSDRAIVAVQLSFDQGETWTAFSAGDTTADKWAYWHFDYVPPVPGLYQCSARAVNEDGKTSPIAAVHQFEAMEPVEDASA